MQVLQSKLFEKQVKKLHKNAKKELDEAIKKIIDNPNIGTAKKGDLAHVKVYKFNMVNQLTLIAYMANDALYLITFGSHENLYRDLKRNQ